MHKGTTNFNQPGYEANNYLCCPYFYHEIPLFGAMCPSQLLSGVGTYDLDRWKLSLIAWSLPSQGGGGFTPIESMVTAATAHVNPYTGVATHSSVYFCKCARSQQSMVEIQRSQRSKPENQCDQRSKYRKEHGQSFDLAVAAVTIEYMGVTPPCLLSSWFTGIQKTESVATPS